MKELFEGIYENNLWNGLESRSGTGSDTDQTRKISHALPLILGKYNIDSMLDIPCGDYHWMKDVDLRGVKYIGADIVFKAVAKNKSNHPRVDFRLLDITSSDLPMVDAVFCRDLLGHFSREDVKKALANIKRSGAKYLIATTFPFVVEDVDIVTGGWRPINMEHYGLVPLDVIDETFGSTDKYMGVYKI